MNKSQRIYQVDAFTDELFRGNPAAVCPLEDWLSDDLMQKIAAENNLAETAFYCRKGDQIHLRWFTPTVEVDLCGHATLAAAYVLFNEEGFAGDTIPFFSPRSGALPVRKEGELMLMDFPADEIEERPLSKDFERACSLAPLRVFKGKTDYLLIYEKEEQVRALSPNLSAISALEARGLIVSAPGDQVDFVSRFFGPRVGVDEDPVTGSAHTTLAPFWAKELGKSLLSAQQVSQREGQLLCEMKGGRVILKGRARLYLKGEIWLA